MEHLNLVLSSMLLVSTAVIFVLAAFSLRHRKIPGSYPFALICAVTVFYSFGYGMELISQTIEQVDFWSKFQYIGLPFIPALWVIISFSLTAVRLKHPKTIYFVLLLIPFLTLIFRLTSSPLQYGTMRMVNNGYFLVLDFDKGPWYYFHILFFFFCAFYSAWTYRQVYQEASGYQKRQSMIMAVASLLSIFAPIINMLRLSPLELDSGPFIVLINYILIMYAIFRYNLFQLTPLSWKKIFDWIQDGVLILDTQGVICEYNRAAGQIFPELAKEAIGADVISHFHLYADFTAGLTAWQDDPDGNPSFEFEIASAGQPHYYQVRAAGLYEKDFLIGCTILISDYTQQRIMLQQLKHLAHIDGLTNLMNRSYFIERMAYEISRSARSGGSIALIIFDIDNFKTINDTLGHQCGDYVLQELAAIIGQSQRTIDLIGRYGGDEFIIFLPDTVLANAIVIAERIRENIDMAKLSWGGQSIPFRASFGVTSYDFTHNRSAMDYDVLVRKADEALYLAKRKGRNRVEAIA